MDDKGEVVEGHRRTEWDIGDWIYRSYDVEPEVFPVLPRKAVTPQTTDVVLAVGQQHIGNTSSVGLRVVY